MDIAETRNKLTQLGYKVRLPQNSPKDQVRLLQMMCDRAGLSPVYDHDLD